MQPICSMGHSLSAHPQLKPSPRLAPYALMNPPKNILGLRCINSAKLAAIWLKTAGHMGDEGHIGGNSGFGVTSFTACVVPTGGNCSVSTPSKITDGSSHRFWELTGGTSAASPSKKTIGLL